MKRILTVYLLILITISLYSVTTDNSMPKETELQYSQDWDLWCRKQGIPSEPNKKIIFQGCETYVFFGQGNNKITKPVIFVEGLDLDNNKGWRSYFYALLSKHGMAKELLAKGYDIIFVNFTNSLESLEANAGYLIRVISCINLYKNGNAQNIVLGASMGGVVSRYALTKMEYNGIDHETSLFVSLDSPQQGAYLPLGIQGWIELHKYYLGSGAPSSLEEIHRQITGKACQQLLNAGVVREGETLKTDSTDHVAFYKRLKELGDYPQNLRKVAIANGSGKGVVQFNSDINKTIFNTHIKAEVMTETVKDITFTVKDRTRVLANNTVPVYITDNPRESRGIFTAIIIAAAAIIFVEEVVGIDVEFVNNSVSYTFYESGLHTAPGSYRDSFGTIRDKVNDAKSGNYFKKVGTSAHFASLQHTFIPTVSALDLRGEEGHGLNPFVNLETIPNIKDKTPFDDIHWEPTNNDHVSISKEASDFILKHIELVEVVKVMPAINSFILN